MLQRRGEWLRVAGLVAIAGAASGAGYATTLWLVPALPSLALEPAHHVLPAAAASEPHLGDESAARDLASNVVAAPNTSPENAQLEAPQPVPAAPALPDSTLADGAKKAKPRPATAAAEKPAAVAPAPVTLDNANWDSFRTELIAERVRAFDEAQAARQTAPSRPAYARAGSSPAPQLMAARETAQAPAWNAPAPRASARPEPQPARLNVWPLMAAANVESLSLRGSLAASSVRRGLERLKPALVSCYGQAAQQTGRNHFGRVQLALTIDETGRVRAPQVRGGGLPGLDACLSSVASKLVTEAPDTGTVAASFVLNFTP